ncbi:MAG: mannitol dehydrogenase [Frankiales bacterium]|nr:mannitol dehydrogenase [Frankiales bacterium]
MTSPSSRSLCEEHLDGFATTVEVPAYDRSKLVPAVVHFGVGGFHRAHQALYFDELAELGETGWGVVGVGLRRPEMGQVLRAQDGLFTVVERSPDGDRARVVGCLLDYHYAPDDPGAVLDVLADPRTRLVTLTITGGGYFMGEDEEFDADDEGVQHDLVRPHLPRTMVGFLVEALRRRRDDGTGPFTVLSCDNLPDSGAAARKAVAGFAALSDPLLAEWILENVTFPSSMVDRITPETTAATRHEVEQTYGVPDRWPVVTEPFRQWVVEDDFCAGRPPLDKVGVQFVDDVGPYKLVKSRILNAGHSALGYLGLLCGYERSDEAMADPAIRLAVADMLYGEVLPLLPAVEGIELDRYVHDTLSRFSNPAIGDRLARLARRGTVKMPSYLLPSLHEARRQGLPHDLLLLAVAAWVRYLRGTDLAGRPLAVDDPKLEMLQALLGDGQDLPRLLRMRSVFGDLSSDERAVHRLTELLEMLEETGLEGALLSCTEHRGDLVA